MKLYRNLMASLALLTTLCVSAVPAMPGYRTYTQPDGTTISLELKGDEYGHYFTTEDGKIVVRNGEAFYFAQIDQQGMPVASTVLASNPTERTQLQTSFLAGVDTSDLRQALVRRQADTRMKLNPAPVGSLMKAHEGLVPNTAVKHSGSPRFLVILVEYSDVKFSTSGYTTNAATYFRNMLTQTGFSELNATGSAYDYFRDASNGAFTPQFDVYGPVTLDNNRAYYGTNTATNSDCQNSYRMVTDACKKLDSSVDFSQYDTDGDGNVDNVFVFFAGQGENNGGPAESVWPHAWFVRTGAGVSLRLDGKYINRYACTNEWNRWNPDGIGTFVHEFSHVLGLPDLYVTNGTTGADGLTPSSYDVMDVGSYNNSSRTPPTYSIFERNAMGWIEPTVISEGQYKTLSLRSILSSNTGYIINSPNPPSGSSAEFFLIENRQKTGWDAYLPNSGLLIWHIDYKSSAWTSNIPNNDASHQCVDIMEANGNPNSSSYEAMAGYTFPGTRNITSFDKFNTWRGTHLNCPLSSIKESGGVVSFEVCAAADPDVPLSESYYALINNVAKLSARQEVIIASEYNGKWYAMASGSNSYVEVSVSNDKIYYPGNAASFTLVSTGNSTYPWAFRDSKNDNKYIGNASSSETLQFTSTVSSGFCAYYDPSASKNTLVFNNPYGYQYLYYYTPTSTFRITNSQSSTSYCKTRIFAKAAGPAVVNPPTPSHSSGTYNSTFYLSFTKDDPDDVIKYEWDDADGNFTGTYSSTLPVNKNLRLRVWAERDGSYSRELNLTYSFVSATPVITPTSGSFESMPVVRITCSTAGAVIYYTTDDSPFYGYNWTEYTGPFIPSGTSPITVRAVASKNGWDDSVIAAVTYSYSSTANTSSYDLVTDASTLRDGQQVIIAASGYDGWMAMRSGQDGAVAVTVNNNSIENPASSVAVYTLVATGNSAYPWSFKDPSNSNKFIGNGGTTNALQFSDVNTAAGYAAVYDPSASKNTLVFNNASDRDYLYFYNGMSIFRLYSETTSTMYRAPMIFARQLEPVLAPIINPGSGTLATTPMVTITCATADAVIYYTTTDADFSTSTWTRYTQPFRPDGSKVKIRAIAVKEGLENSAIVEVNYSVLSGIEGVEIDAEDAEVEYYNLQGIRVVNPTSGFYIRRQGDKATRVYIK